MTTSNKVMSLRTGLIGTIMSVCKQRNACAVRRFLFPNLQDLRGRNIVLNFANISFTKKSVAISVTLKLKTLVGLPRDILHTIKVWMKSYSQIGRETMRAMMRCMVGLKNTSVSHASVQSVELSSQKYTSGLMSPVSTNVFYQTGNVFA